MHKVYLTTNGFRVRKIDFQTFPASHIKRLREDFNDMFIAEHKARLAAGDKSIVFCLSYNDEHLHQAFGRPMLDSFDLKRFAKSSRFCKMLRKAFGVEFDFVCVGEYGEGGITHGYVGKRGKGNNPHYHCVGWFHFLGSPIDKDVFTKYAKKWYNMDAVDIARFFCLPLYDGLCLLLRKEWQGCDENDPHVYGRSKIMRSLGLGYVSLDGEVRSTYTGGAYIAKYIGKDIKMLWSDAYEKYYYPQLISTLYHVLRENCEGSHFSDTCISLDYSSLVGHFLFTTRLSVEKVQSLFEFSPSPIEKELLIETFRYIDGKGVCHTTSIWQYLCEVLTENKRLFDEEFYSYMVGRYSPKVRKFHGFGKALLGSADLEKGTYSIAKPDGIVTRQLPPSLCRYLYYDYFVCSKTPDVVNGSCGCVKYVLNSLGRKKLQSSLELSIQKDERLAIQHGSDNLKVNATAAAVILNCLSQFDWIVPNNFDYDINKKFYIDWVRYMFSYKQVAIHTAISMRQVFVYSECSLDTRPAFDSDLFLRTFFPLQHCAYLELKELRLKQQEAKETKDKEYNEHCMLVYNHQY